MLDNKQEFFWDDDKFLCWKLQVDVDLIWCLKLYVSYIFVFEYYQEQIDFIIVQEFNFDYFGDGFSILCFFWLLYKFNYDFCDNCVYFWLGQCWGGELIKDGIGIFDECLLFIFGVFVFKYWFVGQWWSFSLGGGGKYFFIWQF